MKKRIMSFFLCFVLFFGYTFNDFKKDAYAVAIVDDAAILLAGVLLTAAGVTFSSSTTTETNYRHGVGKFLNDNPIQRAFVDALVDSAVDGVITLGASALDGINSFFDAVASYFSPDGGELEIPITTTGSFADILHNYKYPKESKAFRVTVPFSSIVFTYADGVSDVITCKAPTNGTAYYSILKNGVLKAEGVNGMKTTTTTKYIYFDNSLTSCIFGDLRYGVISPSYYYSNSSGSSKSAITSVSYDGNLWTANPSETVIELPYGYDTTIPVDDIKTGWSDSITDNKDVIMCPPLALPDLFDKTLNDIYNNGYIDGVTVDGTISPPLDPTKPIEKPIDVLSGLGTIGGLINGVIDILKSIFNKSVSLPSTISNTIVGTGTLNFDKFKNLSLISVFPFCIPFDLINCFQTLVSKPAVPKFTLSFKGTILSPANDIVLDMSSFESLAVIVRFFTFLGFIYGLIIVTRNLIKG